MIRRLISKNYTIDMVDQKVDKNHLCYNLRQFIISFLFSNEHVIEKYYMTKYINEQIDNQSLFQKL